jgi:hypothetical protein
MGASYHSFLEFPPESTGLLECVSKWMEYVGIPPFEGDDLVTEGQGWAVTRRHHRSQGGLVTEVVAANAALGLRCVAQELDAPEVRQILIEEDSRKADAVGVPLPEPSAFIQRVLDAFSVEAELAGYNLSEVILVGPQDRHVTNITHLLRRLRGMASVFVLSLEEAHSRVGHDVVLSDGAVVLSKPDESSIVLPALWVRGHPEAAARRMHRDVLGLRLAEKIPDAFRKALVDLHRAGRGVEEWANEADRLDRELRRVKDELEFVLLTSDEGLAELDRVQRRVAFLERAFRERGEVVSEDDEDWEFPDEVNLCIDAMKYAEDLLDGLVISQGATARCSELDEQHSAPITAKRAWRSLRALNDYAQLKADGAWNGNFLQYCQETPSGCFTFPPSDVALFESERTMDSPRCVEARTFPVPHVVHASGYVVMVKHVKVAGIGNLAARLHFYDDTGGATGKIHVGYLGPHLPLQ